MVVRIKKKIRWWGVLVVALALLLASGVQAQTPVTGFVQVDTGGDGVYGEHTCAVNAAGGVQCWGSNRSGQLGDGSTTSRETPGNVSGLASGMSAVSASGNHSCALTSGGEVRCWGANSAGQLGDGFRVIARIAITKRTDVGPSLEWLYPRASNAARAMLAASTPKCSRNCARVSLRPKPSVPSVR